ncbi:MAG: helix-turn-helix transcriptional regulator [Verrucomicrobia bacterium]|jgi:AraC family transcriptional regulator|nr:helix-turn-helix transcriptional regulator [Verrucomicrobiota bacterium]
MNPEADSEIVRADRLSMAYCYGGTVLYERGEVLGPRELTDFEAVLVIDGFPQYESGEGTQVLEPGSILVAQPGARETYRWDTKARTRHAYLHFALETIPSDWPALTDWPRWQLHPPPVAGPLLRYIIERAIHHPDWPAERPKDADNRILEAFLDIYLTGKDNRGMTPPRFLSEPVRLAAKFMRERLDSRAFEPFTLDDLAAAAHVSTKHLCRAFRKELGVSPMKACRLMQFQLAIPLLARSNLRIKAIAERCGFPDQLHFSRYFSQTFGQSPSQIRREMQQGLPPPPNPLPAALMPRLYW